MGACRNSKGIHNSLQSTELDQESSDFGESVELNAQSTSILVNTLTHLHIVITSRVILLMNCNTNFA